MPIKKLKKVSHAMLRAAERISGSANIDSLNDLFKNADSEGEELTYRKSWKSPGAKTPNRIYKLHPTEISESGNGIVCVFAKDKNEDLVPVTVLEHFKNRFRSK